MPALLTITSSRPYSLTAVLTRFSIDESLPASASNVLRLAAGGGDQFIGGGVGVGFVATFAGFAANVRAHHGGAFGCRGDGDRTAVARAGPGHDRNLDFVDVFPSQMSFTNSVVGIDDSGNRPRCLVNQSRASELD